MQLPTPGIGAAQVQQNLDFIATVIGVELDTTGMTSANIETLLRGLPTAVVVSDPVNHKLLLRQNGAWYKVALTAV